MHASSNTIYENLECDILVIGSGGSGLAAAVTAADNGAKVIVLEKRPVPGGATVFAEGIVAAESPTQKRMNIDCTKDDLFKIHMYYSHWTLNARLVRTLIDKSSETVQWLEEKGIHFKIRSFRPSKSVPYLPDKPPVFHCPENYGSDIIKVLLNDCHALGVQILYKTQALKLLTDQSGAVTGLLAKEKDRALTFKAKSIIMATGGYGGSRELMKRYCPFYDIRNFDRLMTRGSHAGDRFRWVKKMHTGEGMEMAFDIGADHEGLGVLLLNGPNFVSGLNAWLLGMNPSTIWVNRDGERFMEESVLNPFMAEHGVLRQPDQVMYAIFDETLKQSVIKAGFGFVSGGKYKHNAAKIDKDLKRSVAMGNAKISDSMDELALWIGADPKTLLATMEEYNSSCEHGYDHLFLKNPEFLRALRTPPYYACKCHPGFLVTIGGIRINHRMEVINKNHYPIRGFYAVGINTGGWSASTYNMSLPGAGCGFPVYAGRIAGENAVKYVTK